MSVSAPDTFEEAARKAFEYVRWGDPPQPICPRCESPEFFWIRARKVRRCAHCRKEFTVTTGTVFDKHKLPLAKLVRAMMFYEQTGGKGKTADLARLLFVTWKTAYVLEMKLFEAYAAPGGPLSEKALIARGYWQGYNLWLLRDRRLVRRNKHGHEKSASPPPPEVSNDPS